MSLSESEAKLRVLILNSNATELDRVGINAKLTNYGLPQEIITRMNELLKKTAVVAGQVIHIGKIILSEIIKFIKEHANLAVGIAIGAAIGALTSMIPFFGPILAPLATAISVFVGGIAGYRIDQGKKPNVGVIGVTQEVILIAKIFFRLFADIFNALRIEFSK